jgi:hypothetical protein
MPYEFSRTRLSTAPARALLVLTICLGACEGGGIGAPQPSSGNVAVQMGAVIAQTDTGYVVAGRTVVRHPYNGRALWLDRFDDYRLGGFPELEYPRSARHSLMWRLTLRHELPMPRTDSLIFRFADHGTVGIAGAVMERQTQTPHFSQGLPIRFENYIAWSVPSYVAVDWGHGSETLERATFHHALVSGAELRLETSGSADAAPLTAHFSALPLATLTAVLNGSSVVPLADAAPPIDVRQTLDLEFDRPLDPAHAFIVLAPFRATNGARMAFIQPREPAQRVVIPGATLDALLGGTDARRTAFRLFVLEVRAQDDVVAGRFTSGAEFALPFVQRSETTLHLYLQR